MPGYKHCEDLRLGHLILEKCKYIKHKHFLNTVYTLRIPSQVRQMMEGMKDVNWQSEIRQAIEDLVRERRREKLLSDAGEVRKKTMNIGISASEMIREDRDAR